MKLVTFEVNTPIGPVQRVGALIDDKILDLNMGYASYLNNERGSSVAHELSSVLLPPSMIDFIRIGKEAREAAEKSMEYISQLMGKGTISGPKGEIILHGREDVKLKSPVPRPNSIRDYTCYEGHVLSMAKKVPDAWYEIPVCYKGNPGAVIGTEETILWPGFTDRLDYELEYGFFIGKEGINIPRDRAEEYIAGYSILNDISARDMQGKEMSCHLGPYKGKDTCYVIGPCLVTPDDLDTKNMNMCMRVNGEVWSEGNAGSSYWTEAQVIEFASMDETLFPGDFIAMGTLAKGCGAELDRWLQPGDIVEMEAEGIGILRNRVGDKGPRRIFKR